MQKSLGIKLNSNSVNQAIALGNSESELIQSLSAKLRFSPSEVTMSQALYQDMELISNLFNSLKR